jgi:hypothetical protein
MSKRSVNVIWGGESIWQDIRPGDTIALPYEYPPGLVLAAEEGPGWVLVLVGGRLVRFGRHVLTDDPVLVRPELAEADELIANLRVVIDILES